MQKAIKLIKKIWWFSVVILIYNIVNEESFVEALKISLGMCWVSIILIFGWYFMKRCPFCYKLVYSSAIRCPHCTANID